jgi:hypothetical protein
LMPSAGHRTLIDRASFLPVLTALAFECPQDACARNQSCR